MLDLANLILRALPRVDIRDVNNGFLSRVEHLEDVIGVGAGIKVITDVELLQVLVAVELLVISISDGIKARFILRIQHSLGITPEVRAGHGYNMYLVTGNEVAQVSSQFVIRIGGDMVKFVDRN